MAKPSTPAVWASGKSFGFQPSSAQQAQGFDYIATVRPGAGAPITDDHDWPLNNITTSLKWVMDQIPDGGIQALLTALLPKRSFAENDFIRIPDVPGGLIMQWGVINATGSSGSTTVTLPTAFPNSIRAVVATRNGVTWGQDTYWNTQILSNSQVAFRLPASAAAFATGYYIAVGY